MAKRNATPTGGNEAKAAIANTPVPLFMMDLPRDPRGYPMPVILTEGNFAVNDSVKVLECAIHRLCGICGKKLPPNHCWLLGGIENAFRDNAAYLDPPMHKACMHYALKVCPYIILKNWNPLDIEKVAAQIHKKHVPVPGTELHIHENATVKQGQPKAFAAIKVDGLGIVSTYPWYMVPNQPYLDYEIWKHGRRLSKEEARAIVPEINPDDWIAKDIRL